MNAPETKTIRLLIVDDHEVTRLGLRTLLEGCPVFEIAGEASSVSETLATAEELKPDLILLDVRLSDGSGIEVCRRLQRMNLDAKVLILTSFADDNLVLDAIAAGADGYLLKEIHGDKLIQAIQDVAAGRSILDPAVTRRVMSCISSPASAARNRLDILSAQERRVVALVAEGKTNKEIGRELGLSDKTVKNYLSNAMEKLNLTRRSQAAAFFVNQTQRGDHSTAS